MAYVIKWCGREYGDRMTWYTGKAPKWWSPIQREAKRFGTQEEAHRDAAVKPSIGRDDYRIVKLKPKPAKDETYEAEPAAWLVEHPKGGTFVTQSEVLNENGYRAVPLYRKVPRV